MRKFVRKIRNGVIPAIAGTINTAMFFSMEALAKGKGGKDVGAVTELLENLKTLLIAVIGAVGVIVLAKNVMEFILLME